jgi:hypothetical protein
MRQSQQERRIAVQLMHVRHEKEVLWQNRIFREKQFEERRLKDFQDALDREAVNKISIKNPIWSPVSNWQGRRQPLHSVYSMSCLDSKH